MRSATDSGGDDSNMAVLSASAKRQDGKKVHQLKYIQETQYKLKRRKKKKINKTGGKQRGIAKWRREM